MRSRLPSLVTISKYLEIYIRNPTNNIKYVNLNYMFCCRSTLSLINVISSWDTVVLSNLALLHPNEIRQIYETNRNICEQENILLLKKLWSYPSKQNSLKVEMVWILYNPINTNILTKQCTISKFVLGRRFKESDLFSE